MDNYIQNQLAKINQLEQLRDRFSGARRTQLDSLISTLRAQLHQAEPLISGVEETVTTHQPSHETIVIDDNNDDGGPLVANVSESGAVQQPIDNEATYWINPTDLAIPNHFRVIQFKPSGEVMTNDLDAALRGLARDISPKIVETAEQLNCLKIWSTLYVRYVSAESLNPD